MNKYLKIFLFSLMGLACVTFYVVPRGRHGGWHRRGHHRRHRYYGVGSIFAGLTTAAVISAAQKDQSQAVATLIATVNLHTQMLAKIEAELAAMKIQLAAK
jgi:pyridoxal/pyridoxine/pyridoxamine kinase